MLLGNWGWLERDQALGGGIYLLGFLLYLAAIVGGWILLHKDEQLSREDVSS